MEQTRFNTALVSTGLAVVLFSLAGCSEDAGVAEPENRSPQLARQGDMSSAVGDTLRIHAQALDPDGDAVLFSALVDLTWEELRDGYRPAIAMDASTGWFSFVPSSSDLPGRSMTFFAEDGLGGRDSTRFHVDVKDKAEGSPN